MREDCVRDEVSEEVDANEGDVPSGNVTSSLKRPPSQIVLSLPGMAHSQRLRSRAP